MHGRHLVWALAALAVAGCGSDNGVGPIPSGPVLAASGQPQRSIVAGVGQEIQLTLGTIGPGDFDSLPALSSASVRFLDAAYVCPCNPGGPTQLFRFTAAAPGRTVIVFQHTGGIDEKSFTVADTIDVR